MFSAIAIARSQTTDGRLVETYRLRYPKFIHGEFMTHRVLSRNASSSRAIPVVKMIEEARNDALRAEPVWWGKNQPGMAADVELVGDELRETQLLWRIAATEAADTAEDMMRMGAHKQIVNRILEPFVHINVVVTSASFDNFFGLRLDRSAQPEMRTLAECLWEARSRAPEPRLLAPGEWHLPYVDPEEFDLASPWAPGDDPLRVSVARCARVSYESFETGRRSTVDEDLDLFTRLRESGHWSPFEHQCTPDVVVGNRFWTTPWDARESEVMYRSPQLHGNLPGWAQYRKTFPGEAVRLLPEEYR